MPKKRNNWWRRGSSDDDGFFGLLMAGVLVFFVIIPILKKNRNANQTAVPDKAKVEVVEQSEPIATSVKIVKPVLSKAQELLDDAGNSLKDCGKHGTDHDHAHDLRLEPEPEEVVKPVVVLDKPASIYNSGRRVKSKGGVLKGTVVSMRYDEVQKMYLYKVRFDHLTDLVERYEVELEKAEEG